MPCYGARMPRPDFNLLLTLDVLLAEGNVARAAERLRLSPSAMSRALARLRETTGDPLLVRAGRGLVPTPRALELREKVSALVQDVEATLRPVRKPDFATLERRFTLRAGEGFVENFGPPLLARMAEAAPGIRLDFVPKSGRDSDALRDGTVDLETGVLGRGMGPEIRVQALFRDRFIGVVRAGHALCGAEMTPALFAAGRHLGLSRRGVPHGPVDQALAVLGLQRNVVATVGGFSTAVALARASDLIASVPERHTGNLRDGMHSFPLPFPVPGITVSLFWHPRLHGDPVHRWLREILLDVCTAPHRG